MELETQAAFSLWAIHYLHPLHLFIYLFIYLQSVYGRFGKKPNEKLIDAYEQFFLGNCDNLKMSRILKVTLSR